MQIDRYREEGMQIDRHREEGMQIEILRFDKKKSLF